MLEKNVIPLFFGGYLLFGGLAYSIFLSLLYLMSTLGGATRAGGMITLRKMNRFVSSSDVVLWHGMSMVVVLIQIVFTR